MRCIYRKFKHVCEFTDPIVFIQLMVGAANVSVPMFLALSVTKWSYFQLDTFFQLSFPLLLPPGGGKLESRGVLLPVYVPVLRVDDANLLQSRDPHREIAGNERGGGLRLVVV